MNAKKVNGIDLEHISEIYGIDMKNINKINDVSMILPTGFILEVTLTTNTTAGKTITLPLYNQGTFDATVDWGDGTSSTITSYNSANRIHEYASIGTYKIEITGDCPGWQVIPTGDAPKITDIISWGDESKFSGFARIADANGQGLFRGCVNLKSTGKGKIIAKEDLDLVAGLFYGCTKLTGITQGLFDNCVNLTDNAFKYIFYGCNQIISIPADLFKYNTLVGNNCFNEAFRNCTNLSSIPADIFKYNINAGDNAFYGVFRSCTALTTIPVDLFRYNTNVSTGGLSYMFFGASALVSVPTELFRYNTSANVFTMVFYKCNKLTLNKNIFYADGEENTRFKDRDSNFSSAFRIGTFTGVKGTAPELWDCDFGSGTVTPNTCFTGHSSSTLTNYTSIPTAWGGA